MNQAMSICLPASSWLTGCDAEVTLSESLPGYPAHLPRKCAVLVAQLDPNRKQPFDVTPALPHLSPQTQPWKISYLALKKKINANPNGNADSIFSEFQMIRNGITKEGKRVRFQA